MTSLFRKIKFGDLEADEFEKLLNETEDAVLIDVRTEEEYLITRIPNSTLIDIYESAFQSEIEKLDKSKSYFVYCRSGSRSYSACDYMTKKGFQKVFNLQDGILSWKGKVERD